MWPGKEGKSGGVEFSIIIPTFNSSKYIKSCLDSIFQLDFPKERYELIVVDGGSVDATLGIVRSFPGVKSLESDNSSISNSRNIGARNAKSENLVFVDSDCIVNPKLLEKATHHLKTHHCCGGFYRPHPSHGWVSKTWLLMENKPAGLVEWVTAGTLAVRKEVFFVVGGFTEDLHTGEDVDFGMKLKAHGYKILNDPTIGSIHLGQANNLKDFFLKEMWRGKSLVAGMMKIKAKTPKEIVFDIMIVIYSILNIAVLISLLSGNMTFIVIFCIFLMITPVSLTIRKVPITKTSLYICQSFVLYITYLFARSASIFYYNQIKSLAYRIPGRRG